MWPGDLTTRYRNAGEWPRDAKRDQQFGVALNFLWLEITSLLLSTSTFVVALPLLGVCLSSTGALVMVTKVPLGSPHV